MLDMDLMELMILLLERLVSDKAYNRRLVGASNDS